jgi:FMN reductase
VTSLAVVSAGLSQPSSTRLLADRLAAAVAAAGPVETTVIEVRDHAHDVVNNLLTGFPSPSLESALEAVAAADGLIAVTPIFNASYSGLFKAFFDVFEESALQDKPVLLAATGGTARHSLALEHALRPMFVHLRALVVPTSVFAAPEDWAGAVPGVGAVGGVAGVGGAVGGVAGVAGVGAVAGVAGVGAGNGVAGLGAGNGGGPSGALARRIERAGRELAEHIGRAERRPKRDPFDLPVTFDRLLSGE